MLKLLCLVLFIAGSLAAPYDEDFPLRADSTSDERIVGGKMAETGQFPYHAELSNRTHFYCGGSIIGERFILTAAQCTYKKRSNLTNIIALVGASSIISTQSRLHLINRLVNHPRFNHRTLANDISVLRTVEKIVFNWSTQPISLPTTDVPVEGNVPATVTGYGQNKMGVSCTEVLRSTVLFSLE